MAAVARRLGVDRKALVAALDADGLAWRRHRPDDAEVTTAVARGAAAGASKRMVAERLGVTVKTLTARMDALGLVWERRGPGRSVPDAAAVVALAAERGWTKGRLCEHLGVSRPTLDAALDRDGVAWWRDQSATLRAARAAKPVPRGWDGDVAAAVALGNEQGWTNEQLAAHLGTTVHVLRNRMNEKGVRRHPPPDPAVWAEHVATAAANGWTQARLAEELGTTADAVRRRLRRAGVEWWTGSHHADGGPGRRPRSSTVELAIDLEGDPSGAVDLARRRGWSRHGLAHRAGVTTRVLIDRLDAAGVDWWAPPDDAERDLAEIVAGAAARRATITTTATELDITPGTLSRRLAGAGLRWWTAPRPEDDAVREAVAAARAAGGTRADVAARLGTTGAETNRALRRLGLTLAATAVPVTSTRGELADLIAEGHTHAEIADRLGVTVNTLRTHLARVGLTGAGRPTGRRRRDADAAALQSWRSLRFSRWAAAAGLDLGTVEEWHVAAFLHAEHLAGAEVHALADTIVTDLNAMCARQDRQPVTRLVRPVVRAIGPRPPRNRRTTKAFAAPLVAVSRLLADHPAWFAPTTWQTAAAAALLHPVLHAHGLAPHLLDRSNIIVDSPTVRVGGTTLDDTVVVAAGLSAAGLAQVVAAGVAQRPWRHRRQAYDDPAVVLADARLRTLAVVFAGRLAHVQAMRGMDPLGVSVAQIRGAADGHHSPTRTPTKTGQRWTRIDHTPDHHLCPACAAAALAPHIPVDARRLSDLLSESAYRKTLARWCTRLGWHPSSITSGTFRRTAATLTYHRLGWSEVVVLLGHELQAGHTATYVDAGDLADPGIDLDAWQTRVRREMTGTSEYIAVTRSSEPFSLIGPNDLPGAVEAVRRLLIDTELLPGHSRPRSSAAVGQRVQEAVAALHPDADPDTVSIITRTPEGIHRWVMDELCNKSTAATALERDLFLLGRLAPSPSIASAWLGPARQTVARAIEEERDRGVVVERRQPPVATREVFLGLADAASDPTTIGFLVAGFAGALRPGSIDAIHAEDLHAHPDAVRLDVRGATKRGGFRPYTVWMPHTDDALDPRRLLDLARHAAAGDGRLMWAGRGSAHDYSSRYHERRAAWDRMCEDVPDLAGLLPRSLRPSGAIYHAEITRDLLAVQRHLGHAHPSTTTIYLTRQDPVIRSAGAVDLAITISELVDDRLLDRSGSRRSALLAALVSPDG